MLIDDNLLEAGFAFFTKVFVNGHGSFSFDPATSAADLIIAGVAAFADSLPGP